MNGLLEKSKAYCELADDAKRQFIESFHEKFGELTHIDTGFFSGNVSLLTNRQLKIMTFLDFNDPPFLGLLVTWMNDNYTALVDRHIDQYIGICVLISEISCVFKRAHVRCSSYTMARVNRHKFCADMHKHQRSSWIRRIRGDEFCEMSDVINQLYDDGTYCCHEEFAYVYRNGQLCSENVHIFNDASDRMAQYRIAVSRKCPCVLRFLVPDYVTILFNMSTSQYPPYKYLCQSSLTNHLTLYVTPDGYLRWISNEIVTFTIGPSSEDLESGHKPFVYVTRAQISKTPFSGALEIDLNNFRAPILIDT